MLPDSFRKNQEGVWQYGHALACLCGLYSGRQSDCRVQLRHGHIRDQICARVVVAEFDNGLMLLRERMGSKKLLLKQREAAETSASGRVSVLGPATVRTFPTVAQHR